MKFLQLRKRKTKFPFRHWAMRPAAATARAQARGTGARGPHRAGPAPSPRISAERPPNLRQTKCPQQLLLGKKTLLFLPILNLQPMTRAQNRAVRPAAGCPAAEGGAAATTGSRKDRTRNGKRRSGLAARTHKDVVARKPSKAMASASDAGGARRREKKGTESYHAATARAGNKRPRKGIFLQRILRGGEKNGWQFELLC